MAASKSSKWKYLIWLLPLAIAVVIFILSSHPDTQSNRDAGLAMELLGWIVRPLTELLNFLFHTEMETVLVLRKAAHVTEFAALFGSLLLAFGLTLPQKGKYRSLRVVLFSFLTTFLYAASDEIHQLFVAGRAGLFRDVCIDCALPALITLVCVIVFLIRNREVSKEY